VVQWVGSNVLEEPVPPSSFEIIVQVALILRQGYILEKHYTNRIQNSHLK
jgi:hypothetical protein